MHPLLCWWGYSGSSCRNVRLVKLLKAFDGIVCRLLSARRAWQSRRTGFQQWEWLLDQHHHDRRRLLLLAEQEETPYRNTGSTATSGWHETWRCDSINEHVKHNRLKQWRWQPQWMLFRLNDYLSIFSFPLPLSFLLSLIFVVPSLTAASVTFLCRWRFPYVQ